MERSAGRSSTPCGHPSGNAPPVITKLPSPNVPVAVVDAASSEGGRGIPYRAARLVVEGVPDNAGTGAYRMSRRTASEASLGERGIGRELRSGVIGPVTRTTQDSQIFAVGARGLGACRVRQMGTVTPIISVLS
jgi:hypothetical protein